MALNINKYLKTAEAKKYLNMPVNQLVTEAFFRDPLRRIYKNQTRRPVPAVQFHTLYRWPFRACL